MRASSLLLLLGLCACASSEEMQAHNRQVYEDHLKNRHWSTSYTSQDRVPVRSCIAAVLQAEGETVEPVKKTKGIVQKTGKVAGTALLGIAQAAVGEDDPYNVRGWRSEVSVSFHNDVHRGDISFSYEIKYDDQVLLTHPSETRFVQGNFSYDHIPSQNELNILQQHFEAIRSGILSQCGTKMLDASVLPSSIL